MIVSLGRSVFVNNVASVSVVVSNYVAVAWKSYNPWGGFDIHVENHNNAQGIVPTTQRLLLNPLGFLTFMLEIVTFLKEFFRRLKVTIKILKSFDNYAENHYNSWGAAPATQGYY